MSLASFLMLHTTSFKNDVKDVTKLVYDMHVMMGFAFGITIENTVMRVWLCPRGLVTRSKATVSERDSETGRQLKSYIECSESR